MSTSVHVCPPPDVSCPSLQASTDDLADPELDRIGSDIEDGGLDLSLSFKPIGAYVEDKREMLDQCFHVLGEKKLRKMLPDELKVTFVCPETIRVVVCSQEIDSEMPITLKICASSIK